MMPEKEPEELGQNFLDIYNGRMSGVLRWSQLDNIWQTLDRRQQWYLYEIGDVVPKHSINATELKHAIQDIDGFLHQQHDVDYCGVVYADNLESPSLLKIYHPRKMGASCGSRDSTVLPKWTLSTLPPIDLLEWSLEKDQKPSWWKHMLKKRA